MLNKIVIPKSYNYIGVFLTFGCNLHCSYCINHHKGAQPKYRALTGATWVANLNRIVTRPDLPITLQGGEPTFYRDFYQILLGIDKPLNIDILTNGQFDINYFISRVDPKRLRRESKYASIRMSYHLETMELEDTIARAKKLQDAGFSVGVWIVDHPRDTKMVKLCQQMFIEAGIDCRLKEFLGMWKGVEYGSYRYTLNRSSSTTYVCKPTEFLLAPDGSIHSCHHTLYHNLKGYANILDKDIVLRDDFTPCSYKVCEPCDLKIKFNRFQIAGHSSVEIKNLP